MSSNWKQITTSDFAWEREALEFAKEFFPEHDPYRAWSNFEFIAQDGSINEIDLMVLTPKGLFLVEIKSHPGVISGNAGTWVWDAPDGKRRVFDNPRVLNDRKAKKLASLLKVQPTCKKSKAKIPFINSLVFLSAENLVNKLEGPARLNVCTRNNFKHEIMHMDENWHHRKIDRPVAKLISRAVEEAGIKESLRMRRVGQYELTKLLDESDHFQEWLANHTDLGIARKVRIYLTYGKSEEEAQRLQKAAKLEFRLLEGIEHPGILKAKDYQQHDHGPALVYEHDPEAVRLDHLLLQRGENRRLETIQAVTLLRLIAEAVQYAHGQRLYHRALSPQSIFVNQLDENQFSIKIANWSTAERVYETETQQISAFSHLSRMIQDEAGPYVALEAHTGGEADGEHMDVFSLGAIAYHLFTGKKPAENDLELQDKLSHGNGLQITDEINGASEELQYLVQYATHPDLSNRLDSVEEFMECLDGIEDELTRPETQRTSNPIEAREGDTFEGGITVKKRLGKGACSVVFLVDYKGQECVLKMAVSPNHNSRLRHEGKTLGQIRHQAIVAYHNTLDISGHTCLLIDYTSEGTLVQRLRKLGAVQLELLERFGDDLLSAISHLEDKAIFHRDIKPENIGLMKQGSQLHLVLFDFSLSSVGNDNITAGTVAYMDPFIRDIGRRRWDDFAERFSAALTLYEMAAGALPGWASNEGQSHLIDGELEIDRTVFDPSIRDNMVSFFKKSLVRDVANRFSNAGEMLKAWRQVFIEANKPSKHPTIHENEKTCPISQAQLDTQIGLLDLSVQALDALSRRNINSVAELIKLNRSKVRVWLGVGSKTRAELSDVIAQLQARLLTEQHAREMIRGEGGLTSIDRLFGHIMPKVTKATDPVKHRFLNEYLGRLDAETPKGLHNVHWPTPVSISAEAGIETSEARLYLNKITNQWGKTKVITEFRDEVLELLNENGGVLTAIELAEAVLLRRGSVQDSPNRERWAQAVARAAVDTELSKQDPRWILRRSGKRILIADNTEDRGEELADYAEALGQLGDECAELQPILSPVRALDKIRAVPAPESFVGLSNHRLLRLAAAASQSAALSSRAEFYPRGMKAAQALELAQGALLGSKALTVQEVQSRVQGRYPAAEPLPGRQQLDVLIQDLDMGFSWDASYEFPNGQKGGYCLPQAGLTMLASKTKTQYHYTQQGELDASTLQEVKALNHEINNAINSARFLALTVRPRQWQQAKDKLCNDYSLKPVSFDELLLRHLHQHCDDMANPPDWNVVLKADAADKTSRDWQNLQRFVNRVLPAMADEIKNEKQAVLLTDPGLIARYDLVNTWLNDLRQQLMNTEKVYGLILLIAADAQNTAAVIDGVTVPKGAGSNEFYRIPSIWLHQDEQSSKVLLA